MVKALLAAILVALVVLIILMLPGARPDRRLASGQAGDGSSPPQSGFVIHNDASPTPAQAPAPAVPQSAAPFVVTPAPPAPTTTPSPTEDSLDTVMQRLRSAKPDATVTVTPAAPAASLPPVSSPPASSPPTSFPPVPSTLAPSAAPATNAAPAPLLDTPPPISLPPPPIHWTNVTEQGVQFRTDRSIDGFVISIDLGGGRVAEVHVLPAFARLDQPAVNARVDYLKQTILENFSAASASYLFNRDGSVTRAR